jgi:hypothetical protein
VLTYSILSVWNAEQWLNDPKPLCVQHCPATTPIAADATTCTNKNQTKWLVRLAYQGVSFSVAR